MGSAVIPLSGQKRTRSKLSLRGHLTGLVRGTRRAGPGAELPVLGSVPAKVGISGGPRHPILRIPRVTPHLFSQMRTVRLQAGTGAHPCPPSCLLGPGESSLTSPHPLPLTADPCPSWGPQQWSALPFLPPPGPTQARTPPGWTPASRFPCPSWKLATVGPACVATAQCFGQPRALTHPRDWSVAGRVRQARGPRLALSPASLVAVGTDSPMCCVRLLHLGGPREAGQQGLGWGSGRAFLRPRVQPDNRMQIPGTVLLCLVCTGGAPGPAC